MGPKIVSHTYCKTYRGMWNQNTWEKIDNEMSL